MPRPRTITDEAILAVAREFFLRDGPAASTREIAKRAGISDAVLFQRFGTKERLFFAAMVPDPVKLDEIFDAAPGQGDVRENLESILLRLRDYFVSVMPVFLKLVSHPAFDFEEFLKGHEIPAMQIGARLRHYLADEALLGRVRGNDIDASVQLLINAIHNEALMDCLGNHEKANARDAVAGAVAALWRGIHPE